MLYINWNVSPEIFNISGVSVRWYGLLFALSFYFGYLIMERFFKKENVPVTVLEKLAMYMIISTVIGARLGHCLFYDFEYYSKNPIEILYIWHGGLASHGAAIAIIIALYIFSRKYKISLWWILDRIVIVVALAGFFIRMGNLMNSEIYGHLTNLPWGFVFLKDGQTEPRHPTQIYEGLSYLLLFVFLIRYYYKNEGKTKNGLIFGIFLTVLFTIRFLIEFLKEPQANFESGMILNMGQILSIPFIIGGIIIISLTRKKLNN